LILRKVSKIGATRCQIITLKCTKFDSRWGFASDPAGVLTALPRPLAVFNGPTSKVREGRGGEGKRREKEGEGKEGRVAPIQPNWGVWICH